MFWILFFKDLKLFSLFLIIFHWWRAWSFQISSIKECFLHQLHGWNWPHLKKVSMYFYYFATTCIFPRKILWSPFFFWKLEAFPQGGLCQFWFKTRMWFWRFRICYNFPFKKSNSSFEETWFPFIEGCVVPCLVEIDLVATYGLHPWETSCRVQNLA